MARGQVVGGGSDYNDWVAIAEHEPLVMFRVLSGVTLKTLKTDDGPVERKAVTAHSVICTGPHKGKITMDEEIIGGGLTNELGKQQIGNDLPCKLKVLKRFARDYAAIVKASDEEIAQIDEMFPPGQEDEVWEQARAKAAEQAAATASAPAANGSAPAASGSARKTPW